MNNRSYLLFFVFLFFSLAVDAQKLQLTLRDIIQRSQDQSPSAKQAETVKENRYWQYRYFKTNYNPQLGLSGDVPSFSKDILATRQNDGSLIFQPRTQTNSNISFGLTQPLGLTGGTVYLLSDVYQFQDYERTTTQWTSNILRLSVFQPIFAFNSLKWQKRTEPIRFEESKREYVEQMEFISRTAVDRFFSVLDAQINLQIAQFNLANNDTIYQIEKGRFNIGTTSEDKLLQVELQLLRSRQDVAQASLDFENAILRLKTFIGLNDNQQVELAMPEVIPQFEIAVEQALAYAKQNRADFIAFERRRLEAERDVEQARKQRFQVNLSASYGLNNRGDYLSDVYANPNSLQRVNINFDMPILDWGRNKSRLQTALANQRLTDYVIAQDEVNFEQEIITQTKQFDMLLSSLEITKTADQVAQKRYEVAQNRYLIGKIDITNLNIALTEKDNAKRAYIGALESYWQAYYDLRRLTLYDFQENRLLYTSDAK
ncbi:MAG: TolC family protein [Imperialibacter sp.]|uniref:TolC family protein n=1 Tax=Imperialibacter sp. TaxID=2038411 RepID=UPI0032F05150